VCQTPRIPGPQPLGNYACFSCGNLREVDEKPDNECEYCGSTKWTEAVLQAREKGAEGTRVQRLKNMLQLQKEFVPRGLDLRHHFLRQLRTDHRV